MTVDEALIHDWISDPELKNQKLLIECLREFKYKSNWLVCYLLLILDI